MRHVLEILALVVCFAPVALAGDCQLCCKPITYNSDACECPSFLHTCAGAKTTIYNWYCDGDCPECEICGQDTDNPQTVLTFRSSECQNGAGEKHGSCQEASECSFGQWEVEFDTIGECICGDSGTMA
jgi:hypothetical protein